MSDPNVLEFPDEMNVERGGEIQRQQAKGDLDFKREIARDLLGEDEHDTQLNENLERILGDLGLEEHYGRDFMKIAQEEIGRMLQQAGIEYRNLDEKAFRQAWEKEVAHQYMNLRERIMYYLASALGLKDAVRDVMTEVGRRYRNDLITRYEQGERMLRSFIQTERRKYERDMASLRKKKEKTRKLLRAWTELERKYPQLKEKLGKEKKKKNRENGKKIMTLVEILEDDIETQYNYSKNTTSLVLAYKRLEAATLDTALDYTTLKRTVKIRETLIALAELAIWKLSRARSILKSSSDGGGLEESLRSFYEALSSVNSIYEDSLKLQGDPNKYLQLDLSQALRVAQQEKVGTLESLSEIVYTNDREFSLDSLEKTRRNLQSMLGATSVDEVERYLGGDSDGGES